MDATDNGRAPQFRPEQVKIVNFRGQAQPMRQSDEPGQGCLNQVTAFSRTENSRITRNVFLEDVAVSCGTYDRLGALLTAGLLGERAVRPEQ